jgi:NitT/TauT family transport system substrate-binding protein
MLRRHLLANIAAGTAATLLPSLSVRAAQERPETTTVRLTRLPTTCIAPQYAAEALLRAEGFTDISYTDFGPGAEAIKAMAGGKADFGLNFAAELVVALDAGHPISIISGGMVGCFELFVRDGIGSIADLSGKRVGVRAATSAQTVLSTIAAHIGLDPIKDIRWTPRPDALEAFARGETDAFLALPPEAQAARARHLGRVIVNTAVDQPWSDYFCCMLGASREYMQKYPAATYRVLRALLKAADLCVSDAPGVARRLVSAGFADSYDYALQMLRELPFEKWRLYDPEDTVRFYALRLRESRMIASSPQKIIAEGTDWRFLNELKRELKA